MFEFGGLRATPLAHRGLPFRASPAPEGVAPAILRAPAAR